jgi:hypothetical protein
VKVSPRNWRAWVCGPARRFNCRTGNPAPPALGTGVGGTKRPNQVRPSEIRRSVPALAEAVPNRFNCRFHPAREFPIVPA